MHCYSTVKQIVTLVVQPIAANIGITLPSSLSAKLNTDKEVVWCMEVSWFIIENKVGKEYNNIYLNTLFFNVYSP